MIKGLFSVLQERVKQMDLGFTKEHDDCYIVGELARAAMCYLDLRNTPDKVPANWPLKKSWWKKSDRRRNLVKAAALIIAEIDRLDRAAGRHQLPPGAAMPIGEGRIVLHRSGLGNLLEFFQQAPGTGLSLRLLVDSQQGRQTPRRQLRHGQ